MRIGMRRRAITLTGPCLLAAFGVALGGCDTVKGWVSGGHANGDATGQAEIAQAAASTPAQVDAAPLEPPGPKPPYNILLITIDSLRADMPWTGYDKPIAPRLTALTKESTVYTHAHSISSLTSRSLGPMLAGHYPSEMLRTGRFFTVYSSKNDFLCEELVKDNIPCVAGMAHGYLNKNLSLIDQGFGKWELVPGITFDVNGDPYVTSEKLTKLAMEQLSDKSTTAHPFFAWYHYMDPHWQYNEHEEGKQFGATRRGLYDQEVFFTDLWVGKLLDWVDTQPWAEKTVVMISADHGEAFGEHGRFRHAYELYEEFVHVPLIVRVPGQPGRVIDEPRSTIDIAKTAVELLGAKHFPADMKGESLVPELFGESPKARDVFCDLPEDTLNKRRRALIHGHHKLIAFEDGVRYELYDLEKDPGEKENLIIKDKELAREMHDAFNKMMKTLDLKATTDGLPRPDSNGDKSP